ncbi:MAG: hypothetical protein ABIE94_03690 [archaeon]
MGVNIDYKELYAQTPHLRMGDPRDIMATKIEVEFNDVYHLKNLYRLCHEWVTEEHYEDPDGFMDKFEFTYWERTKPGGAKEKWIWWRAIKIPHGNQYYRYFLRWDMQVLGSKEVEVMHQGHKFTMNKGNVKFVLEGWLQLDFKDEWQNHWFLKHFDWIFRNRWYKQHIEDYKWELYKDVYKLERQIKDYLQLKNPFERPKLYRPVKGF